MNHVSDLFVSYATSVGIILKNDCGKVEKIQT